MKRRSNEDEEYTTSQQTPKRIRFQLSKQQESSTSPPRSFQAAQQQLPDLLSGLDQKSLIVLLLELVGSDQSLEDRIVKLLPRPTLSSTISILLNLEAKLLSSIPYSKHGPDRSDYAFNRVRPQWEELYGSLLQYLDFFTLSTSYPTTLDHEYPSESFEYLEFTTNLVHRLPNWSEEKMIQLRNPLYEKLGQHWRIVVQEVGRRAGEGKLGLIEAKFLET